MRHSLYRSSFAALAVLGLSCTQKGELPNQIFRLGVSVQAVVDDSGQTQPVPGPDHPLCLDLRGIPNSGCPQGSKFLVNIEAIQPDGTRDTSFNGFARLTVSPGSVVSVTGPGADGHNVLLKNGVAEGETVQVIGAYGQTHIKAEDLGYTPADPLNTAHRPQCADGIDNNGNGLIDFPADPGCAFANDDTEDAGTFAAGVSQILYWPLPSVGQVRGFGPNTTLQEEGVTIATDAPQEVILTALTSSGFYVSSIKEVPDPITGKPTFQTQPFGGLFVFNFGIPNGVSICDRMTYLSGTMDEFFGFAQLSFPSFGVKPWDTIAGGDGLCRVPDAVVLNPLPKTDTQPAGSWMLSTAPFMDPLESQLVRLHNMKVAANLGSDDVPATPQTAQSLATCKGPFTYTPTPTASNCDFNHDGKIEFTGEEGVCSCFCYADPNCSEWSEYVGRSNLRVVASDPVTGKLSTDPADTIQISTSTVATFAATVYRGKTIPTVSGMLSKFSGGKLNWTVNVRCPDDLVLCPDGQDDCTLDGKPSNVACVKPRTSQTNDTSGF